MIGSLITRVLVLIFGYVYPAYECFKAVEMNKPDIDQLRFWCQYWILVAGLTVCERISDMFIGWIPMYGEAKLAFFIYLWFPKTKGTKYVYDSFFKPYVAKHETEIDRNLLELRIRAGDMIVMYWQKAASYSQTRIFDILQFIASQSTPPRPAKQGPRAQKSSSSPPSSSPASNTSPSEQQEKTTEAAAGPSEDSKSNTNAQKATPTPSVVETRKPSISSELQVREIDSDAPAQEENMEDNVRVTRARARKITRASTR